MPASENNEKVASPNEKPPAYENKQNAPTINNNENAATDNNEKPAEPVKEKTASEKAMMRSEPPEEPMSPEQRKKWLVSRNPKQRSAAAAIPGRMCRCKSSICMVDTFKYTSLKELMFAKLALQHPGPETRDKFDGFFEQYARDIDRMTDEAFHNRYPCGRRGSASMIWSQENSVWKKCFGEFVPFPGVPPLKGKEFKLTYRSLQDLIWCRIMHEGSTANPLTEHEKWRFEEKAKECLETAKGSYFGHSPQHQMYRSEFHLWGWYLSAVQSKIALHEVLYDGREEEKCNTSCSHAFKM
ncbi:hypothetical protein M7I_1638 [Glarea lozoyensis 74030]|uniref:Uncharacterized protein n=1 Tax=Glarea lozoyensis (strain ATCC 74030 / MF5533) TaxID=1104152 RepID=H0EGM1_GLAL7|nr:hypothetical protein M7I_1638 [Glarea lozoyensis 74030]